MGKNTSRELKAISEQIDLPYYITINQASKMCGLPYSRVRKLIDDGDLEYFMAESRYYIDAHDLKAALKKAKQRKNTGAPN